jgi:hypothetical protein
MPSRPHVENLVAGHAVSAAASAEPHGISTRLRKDAVVDKDGLSADRLERQRRLQGRLGLRIAAGGHRRVGVTEIEPAEAKVTHERACCRLAFETDQLSERRAR